MDSEELYDDEYINLYGNFVHRTAIVYKNVKMGKGNVIGPYCVIGELGFIRDTGKKEGYVEIGDNNRFGCYVNVMTGQEGKTFIGNKNLIMNHVNIGHNVMIGDDCEIGAGSIVCGWVLIGSCTKIKSQVSIRNRIKIDPYCTIGIGSNVICNIPLNSTAYGNPAKVYKKGSKQGKNTSFMRKLLEFLEFAGSPNNQKNNNS